jgi:hypothetical protein
MFKQRLKETGTFLGGFLIASALCVLFVFFLNLIHFYEGIRFLGTHLEYIGYAGLILFACALLFGIGYFINWQFVQPFRYWLKNKN